MLSNIKEYDCNIFEYFDKYERIFSQRAFNLPLHDVYPPIFDIGPLSVSGLRGDIRQIFAQYEAFLVGD